MFIIIFGNSFNSGENVRNDDAPMVNEDVKSSLLCTSDCRHPIEFFLTII